MPTKAVPSYARGISFHPEVIAACREGQYVMMMELDNVLRLFHWINFYKGMFRPLALQP